jgi:hypothetical protein
MVVFAANAAGARRAAEGRLDGDGNVQWSDSGVATVTELVVGAELADAGDDLGWSLYCRIIGGTDQVVDPTVVHVDGKTRDQALGILGANRLHIGAIAVNDGGTATYVIDEILTVAGGTFTRAATMRVITVSTGVILTVELVDPGEYSVLPSMTANAVTGGGGTVALMDLTVAAPNSYEALVAQLITDLAGAVDFTPSVDFGELEAGTRLITLGTVGDAMGGAFVELEFRHNGTVETVLLSTIVDDGIDGAVLTVAIPASPLAPPRVHVFNHNPL